MTEIEDGENRCISWSNRNAHKLMAFFILVQIVISVTFLILYFIETTALVTWSFKIYSSIVLAIFTGYMVHFAYHSVIY